MKEILITNDDGFEALGLKELAKSLKTIANVTIVAPSSEKSACAHSITCTRPLRFIKIDDGFFKLDDATPTDCIYLALHTLYENKPDLIISGINHGSNIAEDITYSGTCAGAMEGVLQGIPSLSVSQFYNKDSIDKYGFDLACEITLDIVKKIFEKGYPLPRKQFLNLNIPAVSKKDYKGLKVVPAGEKIYSTAAQLNRDPRGIERYWIGADFMDFDIEKNDNTDLSTIMNGYASLTPIKLNLTAYEELKRVDEWIK